MSDPCGEGAALSYEAALARLIAHAGTLPDEACAGAAHGRVLAEPVHAHSPLPPFDNAAMDGYALQTGGDAIDADSVWTLAGQIAAGDLPPSKAARAWEIMTGAPLPPDADSVVPFERTERLDATRMRVLENVEAARHIRRAGSDLQPGDTIAAAGTRVDATLQMLLAAAGLEQIRVRRTPRVAILSTGKELVADPRIPLQPGQIRASNAPFLDAALRELGVQMIACHTLGDEPEVFAGLLAGVAGKVDLVLTTGAVSAGVHDFIPATLRAAGATVLFHKTAIRPGKPLLAARLPDGPLVLGLPGNPVATAVGFRFFAVPLLRHWLGLPIERPLRARLAAIARGRSGMRHFLKARVDHDDAGGLRVQLLTGQESYRIGTLLHANAWATIEAPYAEVAAGEWLHVYPRDADGRWQFD